METCVRSKDTFTPRSVILGLDLVVGVELEKD